MFEEEFDVNAKEVQIIVGSLKEKSENLAKKIKEVQAEKDKVEQLIKKLDK